jgi:protein-S-isoprenylcysteine O-methyltransferase Ste14
LLLLVSSLVYFLFGFWVPDYPEFWHSIFHFFEPDLVIFTKWTEDYLTVCTSERWNRLMLLSYLSLYCGMWWAYFASKKYAKEDPRESKSLKIQSLRRLLGMTSYQWQPHDESTCEDDESINTFRRKSDAGMQVIAILVAVSILIFDQINSIWMSGNHFTIWQYAILWLGMFTAVLSFISFMMCVDALDTIYNRFTNDPVRNLLVKYFYNYTLNPRYTGGAAMLLSVILLLGFHSELLGCLAVIVILIHGYDLWFPRIQDPLNAAAGTDTPSLRKSRYLYGSLLLMPIVVRALVFLTSA